MWRSLGRVDEDIARSAQAEGCPLGGRCHPCGEFVSITVTRCRRLRRQGADIRKRTRDRPVDSATSRRMTNPWPVAAEACEPRKDTSDRYRQTSSI